MSALTDAVAALQAAIGAEETRSAAALQGLAGQAAAVAALVGQQPAPTPTPTPVPVPVFPQGANTVQIGTSQYPLAAIDPTPASHPSGFLKAGWNGRGQDELIIYTSRLDLNQWGAEAAVEGGVLGTLTARKAGGTAVPPGGFVLSGNGKAETWLESTEPGQKVQVLFQMQPVPTPTPTPTPVPTPATGKTVAGYLMDGQDVDTIPACYNQIRVAFVRMTNGVLTPVEWGGKTPAQTQAQLTAWASQPGHRVLLSTGGSGGGDNLGDPAAFVSGYRTLAPEYASTGVDFDEEGTFNGAGAIAISKALASDPAYLASFVPPGGPPVDIELTAAKALHDAGVRVQFGFQGYDAVDSDDDILNRTADAVAALGAPNVLIGFMIGNDPKHRTPAQCESLMRKVVARWPDIGGAYAWQIAAPGTTDAMQRVAAVLGL